MALKIWILYLITEFLLSLTPGPAVMLVSTQGFKYGAKPSYYGSLGISTGNILYFILSALGLGALILAAGNLFMYIKIAGALYLIGSGFMMIYNSFKRLPVENTDTVASQDNLKSYIQGFITQAANPKAIIFFVALIPQFVDQTKNIILQFSIMAITTLIVETSILFFYGWFAAKGKSMIKEKSPGFKWRDLIAGSVLIGLGINLLLIKFK